MPVEEEHIEDAGEQLVLSTWSWGRGCITYIIKVPQSSAVKALGKGSSLEKISVLCREMSFTSCEGELTKCNREYVR